MSFDLQSTINQSAADKLINSVSYPFTVFERKTPYEGLALLTLDRAATDTDGEMMLDFDDAQHAELLKEVSAIQARYAVRSSPELTNLASETRQALDEITANAEECLAAKRALDARPDDDKPAWDGPSEVELKEIIATAGAQTVDLAKLRKTLGDWGITPLVTWIKVQLREAPVFTLNSPTFGLGVKVGADGTGEVWLKHPWLKCVKKKWGICYGWKKVIKHTLLLRVTLRGIKVKAKAQARLSTEGALVKARGEFIELRLDHKYLDKIPLGKIANQALGNDPVTVFDAGQLVATVPVLGSRFTVGTVQLPSISGAVTVQVTLKQV